MDPEVACRYVGDKMFVGDSRTKSQFNVQSFQYLRKIFIGGLSYGTDDGENCLSIFFCLQIKITISLSLSSKAKLRQYFEAFGSVQDAVVMKDPVSRRSRGFGFITFQHKSFVDKALEQAVHTIDMRKVQFVFGLTCFDEKRNN